MPSHAIATILTVLGQHGIPDEAIAIQTLCQWPQWHHQPPVWDYDAEMMTQVLAGYDSWQLAVWSADFNGGRWPKDFPLNPPTRYFKRPDSRREELDVTHAAWKYCETHATPEDLSKAWWLTQLGRTEDEWQTWWDATDHRLPTLAELRGPDGP